MNSVILFVCPHIRLLIFNASLRRPSAASATQTGATHSCMTKLMIGKFLVSHLLFLTDECWTAEFFI
ncbi:hypothetical protein RMSM_05376 [Rhodopirellula maiorica SM1]|uniref:Uncharacterized protein n=1 Tax=Rhodopirellula maiorica SM1 TaxID=1265738 RepID=M5RE10_9BACT|nr:hypothetical protein RMSM_05376 [Rhodopirellula maiorica SM1]